MWFNALNVIVWLKKRVKKGKCVSIIADCPKRHAHHSVCAAKSFVAPHNAERELEIEGHGGVVWVDGCWPVGTLDVEMAADNGGYEACAGEEDGVACYATDNEWALNIGVGGRGAEGPRAIVGIQQFLELLFGREVVAQGAPGVYAYTLWLDVSACRKVGVYVDKTAHSTTNVEKNNKFYGKIKIIT